MGPLRYLQSEVFYNETLSQSSFNNIFHLIQNAGPSLPLPFDDAMLVHRSLNNITLIEFVSCHTNITDEENAKTKVAMYIRRKSDAHCTI